MFFSSFEALLPLVAKLHIDAPIEVCFRKITAKEISQIQLPYSIWKDTEHRKLILQRERIISTLLIAEHKNY